jgi:DNA-binding response OmpR family regulator
LAGIFVPGAISHRPVVMVVEDDVEMNELQRELLAVHGLDTVAAYTGVEALEVFSHQHADAVLLDIMLPEMDGFECCQQLKHRNGQKLPVVIVTALDSEDCRRRGFEAGADGYFVKPFDPDEVVDAIRHLIDEAGDENDARQREGPSSDRRA